MDTVDEATSQVIAGENQELPASTKADTGSSIILALTNQKGGVGKTTTAVNLGACLAEGGARVLLVDLDPQGNATTGVGIDRGSVKAGTYELLGGSGGAEAILATDVAGLDVLPSTIDLAGAEVELVSAFSRETKLRQGLAGLRGEYDFVLIDSPPSLGLLTVNALAACDEVVVPIQCEYYALEGLGQLIRTLDLVRDGLNPSLRVGGVVLTMFDARTKSSSPAARSCATSRSMRSDQTPASRVLRSTTMHSGNSPHPSGPSVCSSRSSCARSTEATSSWQGSAGGVRVVSPASLASPRSSVRPATIRCCATR